MKVITERVEVERSGSQESAAFTIKSTAKSFEILSSALYSDKIKAIVRELSCNAYDSHVAAGCPERPIELHLPSILDDRFYVKDYGLGLSHEDVMHLYSTYFESTKTNSDDYIGQLGLGSKSPFSYAATFTVESRFNGMKRIYTCYKDEDLFPRIDLMHTEETDEPNGVTVSLTVRSSDVDKFTTAAKKALMYFKPQPVIANNDTFRAHTLRHTITGSNWKLRDAEYYAYMSGSHVVQGFVSYPVDVEQLAQAGLSGDALALGAIDIDLFVPIGQVEIAPSREALSYDRRTVRNLITEFDRIASEIRTSFQAQFDACTTAWDAAILVDKLRNSGDKLSKIFSKMHVDTPFLWNNEPVTQQVVASVKDVQSFILSHWRLTPTRRLSKLTTLEIWRPGNTVELTLDGGSPAVEMTAGRYTRILVNNSPKKMHRASVTKWISEIDAKAQVYVINALVPASGINQAELDAFIEALGGPTAVLYTDIPYIGAAPRQSTNRGRVGRRDKQEKFVWNGFDVTPNGKQIRKFGRRAWATETIDMEAGGFYVPIDRYEIVTVDQFDPRMIDNVISYGETLGLINKKIKIVGLNAADRKTLAKREGQWVELIPHLREQFIAFNKVTNYADAMVAAKLAAGLEHSVRAWVPQLIQSPPQFVDGPFKDVIGDITSVMVKAPSDINADLIDRFVNDIGGIASKVHHTYVRPAALILKKWSETIAQYEMLKLVPWAANDSKTKVDHDAIINYVNLVDTMRASVEGQTKAA